MAEGAGDKFNFLDVCYPEWQIQMEQKRMLTSNIPSWSSVEKEVNSTNELA